MMNTSLPGIRGTKSFEPLAVSFKRIRKILEKAAPGALYRGGREGALLRRPPPRPLGRGGRGSIVRPCGGARECGEGRQLLCRCAGGGGGGEDGDGTVGVVV